LARSRSFFGFITEIYVIETSFGIAAGCVHAVTRADARDDQGTDLLSGAGIGSHVLRLRLIQFQQIAVRIVEKQDHPTSF